MRNWTRIIGIGLAVGVFGLGDGLASAMPGNGVPAAVVDQASTAAPVVEAQYYPYPYPYYGYPCVFPFRCGYGYYGRGYYGRGYYGRGYYGRGYGGRGFAGGRGHR
jgi:hypothetical protein